MFRFFNAIGESIDLYSISPSSRFKYKHKQNFSTTIGQLFSIAIYALIITALVYFSQNLLYKTTSQTLTSDLLTPNPEAFPLSKENFFFAFAIQNTSNNFLPFIDNQIYNIKAEMRIKKSNDFSAIPLQIGECNSNDYPTNADLRDYFAINSMAGYYCIKNFTDLELLGYWDSPTYKDLMFYVRPCRNGTSDVICKDQKVIDKIFDGGYFGSYLTTSVVDTSNYLKPVSYTPMNFYTRVSLKTYVFIELSLQHNEIQTDSGFLMEDINIVKGVTKSTERQSITIDPTDILFELMIKLDRIKKVHKRKYDKIQDVLANAGGIFNFLVVSGSIFIRQIVQFLYLESISYEIFDMEDINNDNNGKNKRNACSHYQATSPGINNKFNLNFSKKIANFFQRWSFNYFRKKLKLLHQADKQINLKMDITLIMNKLLELDKMKFLLFNKDQIKALQIMPKPKVFSNMKVGTSKMEAELVEFNKVLMTKQIKKTKLLQNSMLRNSLESMMSKESKDKVDERLIKLLRTSVILPLPMFVSENESPNETKIIKTLKMTSKKK